MNKKKLAPLLLLSLFIAQSPSRGIVGGPFDNNTVPGGGADGTYAAVLTGSNLTGFVTFGVGNYSGTEGNGRFAVFHEGAVHYGAVSGTADLSSKRVAAALLGVAGLQQTIGGVFTTETTGGSGTTTNSGQTLTVRSSTEGSFSAFINGLPSQIRFEGDGELSSTANNSITTLTSDVPNVVTITIPSQTETQTQGEEEITEQNTVETGVGILRTRTNFKVRGSRTSTQPYIALNSYTALPPLVPTSPGAGTPAGTPVATPTPPQQ